MLNLVTHNGKFHADEVMALAILSACVGGKANVIRTRDVNKYLCDSNYIVVDVGGHYSALHNNYDHHQPSGAGTRENGIPYASAGLVWKHYGHTYLNYVFETYGLWDFLDADPDEVQRRCNLIVDAIDKTVIEPIDAFDNNYRPVPIEQGVKDRVASNYIGPVISSYNRAWFETESSDDNDSQFMAAMNVASEYLLNMTKNIIGSVGAEAMVREYASNAKDGIMIMEKGIPWKPFIKDYDDILFVIIPHGTGWNIQTVDDKENFRTAKKLFPEHWGGKEGEELRTAIGAPEEYQYVFCHRQRFIMKADTMDAAMFAVRAALAHQ